MRMGYKDALPKAALAIEPRSMCREIVAAPKGVSLRGSPPRAGPDRKKMRRPTPLASWGPPTFEARNGPVPPRRNQPRSSHPQLRCFRPRTPPRLAALSRLETERKMELERQVPDGQSLPSWKRGVMGSLGKRFQEEMER
jgi:hypothetical protein